MAQYIHRKLVIEDSILGCRAFADWYRFGDPSLDRPVVSYIGGRIHTVEYARRFETEPMPVLERFREALASVPLDRVDLTVSSAPPLPSEPEAEFTGHMLAHLRDEILARLPVLRSSAQAFVGYSLGAHLATHAALATPTARALSVVGGVQVAEAAIAAPPGAPRPLPTMVFSNDCDVIAWTGQDLETTVPPGVLAVSAVRRAGEHGFLDYACNGSLTDAFAFALGSLV